MTEPLTKDQVLSELSKEDHDPSTQARYDRDAERAHTRRIRSRQFAFAMRILCGVLAVLIAIVGIEVIRRNWGLPLAAPLCATAACELQDSASELLDWAKALINTLFGAALAMALGSLYSPDRRQGD